MSTTDLARPRFARMYVKPPAARSGTVRRSIAAGYSQASPAPSSSSGPGTV